MLSETALFPRSIWNFHNDDKTRTNNISETYNHKINGKITVKNTNIYKVLRANLGQFKRKDNAQLLNLQTINTVSKHLKNFDEKKK